LYCNRLHLGDVADVAVAAVAAAAVVVVEQYRKDQRQWIQIHYHCQAVALVSMQPQRAIRQTDSQRIH